MSWSVAAIASGTHLLLYKLHDGDGTWWGPIATQFVLATMWAMVTPLVFEIVRRFGDEPRWQRRLAPVIASGVAIDLVFSCCRSILHRYEHLPESRPCIDGWLAVIRYLHIDIGIFAAVFSLALAHRYLRQREAQRARAAAVETQLARARLVALQMQLNPHFLFNALNTISAMVERDPAATRTVVARLSELLRRTLDVRAPEVPLDDELRFIRGYLEIMQLRFGDRLRTELVIEDGLDDALVPAFILQPLVENAVEHGIAQLRGTGVLELRAWRDGDRLRISVRDNGLGLGGTPGDNPGGHRGDTGGDTGASGIGLANTTARLAQLYPGRGVLRVGAGEPRGTVAEIELPYHTAEDADGGEGR